MTHARTTLLALAMVATALSGTARAEDGDAPVVIIDEAPPRAPDRPAWRVDGRFALALSVDLAHDDDEDHASLLSRSELGLRTASDAPWMGVAAARLTWLGRAGARSDAPAHGIVEGELVSAYARWRTDVGLTLAAGLQPIRWSGAVAESPLEPFAPRELRFGPDPPDALPPLSVWALTLDQRWGPVTLSAVFVPSFRAHRVELAGTDWAALQPSAGLVLPEAIAAWTDDRLAARGLFDDEPLRVRATTAPPPRGLAGAQGGARASLRTDQLDLAIGWAYRWDPVPRLLLDPAVPRGFRTEHGREHLVGASASWTVSPVILRAEAAWRSHRTVYRGPELASLRAPSLHAVVEAETAPWPFLRAILSVAHARLLDDEVRAGDVLVGTHPVETRVHGRVELALAWAGAVTLDVRGWYGVVRGDGALSVDLGWRTSERVTWRAGVRLLEGGEGLGLARLYEGNDVAYLGAFIDF